MADAPVWRLPIRDALRAMTEKNLDGDTFLRSVMHHDRWLVSGRVHPDGRQELGVLSTPKGRILEVYSDEEALALMERVHGDEFTGSLLQLEGHALFAGLEGAGIDRVNLNPGSEPKLSYRNDQVDLLVAWGKQARAELAVLEPDRVREPFAALATYDSFYMVYELHGEHSSLVLAPDSLGRALGAVFTSWDTADTFRAVMQDESDGVLEVVRQSAADVFPLMQRLDVQGIVFNPWSQLPARALSAGILSEILPRLHPAH